MPDDHNDNNSQTPREPKIPGMPGGKKPTRTGWLYFLLACALLGYAFFNMGSGFASSSNTVKLATSEMVSAIKQDCVEDLTYTVQDGSVTGHYWKTKKDKGDTSELKSFSSTYVGSDSLAELMAEHPDTKYIVNTNDPDFWGDLAMSVLPTIALIAIMFYFMRQMMGANNRNMQFGKTNAKTNEATRPKVKFEDVAGVDEAVEELEEIRDFLSDPDRYRKLGAKIPRGVLLVGPPGTGKTLLAKAVAGEAGVPFFSISGSDFVEMFVGVGASRVRDLFKEAKSQAPSIIFIDEIDAVGRQRGAGLGGGHDEREQTLNQLLVEMDGFEESESVILIAATNRPDILDPALLRPGRFDRRIIVDRPDLKGRVDVLKVHAKNVNMDETVDLDAIALATSGAVGSDLANMINEAAILAVKKGRKAVSQKDLFEAVEIVLVGKEKKDRILSQEERRIVSYHEVGHALVSALQKDSEPVQKITIIPRTMGALGYVMNVPEEEKYLNTEKEIRAMLVEFVAGRAAEEIVFDTVTTGASNDIEKATRVARSMVTQYGMSKKFGLIGLEVQANQYLDNRPVMNCSEATAAEVDAEVMKVLKESYDEAKRLLTEHRKALDKIAAFLIEKETITGKEFMQIFHEVEGITETDHKEPEARIRQRPTEETSTEEVSAESQPEAGDVIALPPTSETDIAQPKTEEAAGDMPEEAPTAEEVRKDTAKDEVYDNGSETVQPATDEAAGTSLEEKTDRL